MRIDSHHHLWHYDPAQHTWMTDDMAILRRDYLPVDLAPLLAETGFDGTIAVQARQTIEETSWLLEQAQQHPFIRGVVGWMDLCSPQRVEAQLERFGRHPRLVGVRHVLHDEPDDRFMLRADFQAGLSRLAKFDLVYDLLIFPHHLPIATQLVERFPDQRFVLDHIAKPPIADGRLSPWREDLARLAGFPNVACKLSGMVTEARWGQWQANTFHPYLDVVLDGFGPERVMIGSDWPVCTLSGGYARTMGIVLDYVQQRCPEAADAILGGNAARIYRLDVPAQ